jgi:hypothetical protein
MFTEAERAEIKRARAEWQDNARANKVCEVITLDDGKLIRQVFATVEEAQKVHSWVNESRGMRGRIDGKDAWRFESTKAYERLSK